MNEKGKTDGTAIYLMTAALIICAPASILILGGVAIKCFKDYEKQKKAGVNPEFKAADIGLKQKTDFWN